jgi:Tfp pilus assembly protein FimV
VVKRCKVLVMLIGLLGGPFAGASERLVVDVFSALGEPLLATLALPSDAPATPVSLQIQGSLPSIVVDADGLRPGLLRLRSEGAIDAPIVQGVLRVGQGADLARYSFSLFLDQPASPRALIVASGTTLWHLAGQWPGPPGSTRAQRMAALFHHNPQAFLAGDPGRLLAGARLQLPSPKAVLDGPRLPSAPRLEVRLPAPQAAQAQPLEAALEAERAALAAALDRAEADRRAFEAASATQAAQLEALRAQLERQQQALAAMERVAEVMRAEGAKPQERERAFGAWALLLLTGATLAGLAGLAGLGVMLRRRRQGVSGVSAPPTPPVPSAPAAKDAVAGTSGLRAYEPSALVQRFGAQSLLSQRDWSPVLDQVEMALAYGRLAEAEAALSAALDEDPHSVALRLQSLALAVERRDRSRFEQEAASLARGADATLLAKLEELEERLPPPSPPPEAPGLANRFILETPEDEEDALAPGAKGALPSLGTGLSLAPEGEGLDGVPSEAGSPSRD